MGQLYNLGSIPMALKENSLSILEYYGDKSYLKKTYSEIYIDLMKLMVFLKKKGISKGDRIGIIGKNSYEYLLTDLAAILGGYVSVPFPEKDFKNQTESLSHTFELKLLFADEKYIENSGKDYSYNLNQLIKLIENEDYNNAELCSIDDEDVFTIIFTSGTTGCPKGIEMRVKCVEEWITTLLDRFEFFTDDKVIDFLPLSISNARLFVYASILIKFNLVLTTPEHLMRVLAVSQPTILQGVPHLFETIHWTIIHNIKASFSKYLLFKTYLAVKVFLPQIIIKKLQNKLFKGAIMFWGGKMRLMVTGSAPISKSILKFYDDIGLRIYEAYGINEIGLVSINSPGGYRIGSVGKPFPTKKIIIGDNKEILIKSDYSWGRRYINDDKGYSECVFRQDGFVSTGDMGYIDKDGFLHIEGRIKEVIVLNNGDKIHPNIIEEELKNTQLIKQAVAIGDQRAFVICLIVLADESIPKSKISEIVANVNKKLPETLSIKDFIIAREVFTVDNGLLNSTLKVNRSAVYKAYRKEIEDLYK